jgi:hypothetical protein
VHYRGFHRKRSSREIIELEDTFQHKQCGELHDDPDSTDKIELQPAQQDVSGASSANCGSGSLFDLEFRK